MDFNDCAPVLVAPQRIIENMLSAQRLNTTLIDELFKVSEIHDPYTAYTWANRNFFILRHVMTLSAFALELGISLLEEIAEKNSRD